MSLPQDTAIELAKMRALLPPEPTATTLPGARLTITGLDPPEYDWVQDADNELREGIGDPNGLLRAPISTLYLDKTSGAPKLWQNQDGGTTWTDLTAAGGSASFPIAEDDGTYTYTVDSDNSNGDIKLSVVKNAGSVIQSSLSIGHKGLTVSDASSFGSLIHTTGSGGIELFDSGGGGIQIHETSAADILIDSTSSGKIELRTTTANIKINPGGNLGFFGATGTTKQTVTGSRGGNAALASLLTALDGMGFIVDGSS